MKIANSHSINKKIILLPLIVILLLVVAAVVYVYAFNGNILGWQANNSLSKNIDTKPATPEQIKAGQITKQQTVDSTTQSDKSQPSSTGTASPSSNNPSLAVTITAANQNGATLQVRSLIDGVTNTGKCTLELTQSSRTITKEAGIQPLANSSTCQGFDVPTSELSTGNWQLKLTVISETKSGSASKLITIK